MKEDYIDSELGWRIQIERKSDGVDYLFTDLKTKETIQGEAIKRAFRQPHDTIKEYLEEKERINNLRAAGVLGNQISRRILEMVGELHLQGFESLYLDAQMAPSGFYWRYNIGSMKEKRWPHPKCEYGEHKSFCVQGSIGGGLDQKIPWGKAQDPVIDLAKNFRKAYPRIMKDSSRPNSEYIEWYKMMLVKTKPDGVLIFSSNYEPHYEYAFTCGGPRDFKMPMPPGYLGRGK
jgi:hypothetical protein